MKFVLLEESLKVFAKGLQFLSRLSDVIYFETTENELSLKSINSQKSSYGIVAFHSNFFVDFTNGYDRDNTEENSCKLQTKPLLKTFRNFKNIQQAAISLDVNESKLVVKYKYGDNAFRTHRIRVLDHDFLNANLSRNDFSNQLFSLPKTFTNIAKTFQLNEDEITFKVSDTQVIINNYEAALSSNQRIMKSQMTMCLSEFNRSSITEPTSITFCFREFRAFLVIASYLRLNMTMNFHTSGRPVSFMIKKFELFEVGLMMSTVSGEDEARLPSKSRPKHGNKFNSSIKRKKQSRNESSKWRKQKRKANTEKSLLDDGNDDVFSQIPLFIPFKKARHASSPNDTQMSALNISGSSDNQSAVEIIPPKRTSTRIDPLSDDSPNISNYSSIQSLHADDARQNPITIGTDSIERALHSLRKPTSAVCDNPTPFAEFNPIQTNSEITPPIQNRIIPQLQTVLDTESEDIQLIFEDDSEKSNRNPRQSKENNAPTDVVPSSPELHSTFVRRTRRIFKRCFEPTFHPENFPGASQLLAENSDGE